MESDRNTVLSSSMFSSPLYTIGEATNIVGVSDGTLRNWTKPYRNGHSFPALITKLEPWNHRSVPFVGLAEAMVLKGLRAHASLQGLRMALGRISSDPDQPSHFLASDRFYRSGADILYNFSPDPDDFSELVVINRRPRHQVVFIDIVRKHLESIDPKFDDNGYITLMRLPDYKVAEVVVDPRRGGGDPIFAQGGCRVRSVLQRFSSGETLEGCSEEFGVPVSHIEDALRVISRRVA